MSIGYDKLFTVSYTSTVGNTISSAVLARLGSNTHAYDMEQRLIGLCGPAPQPSCGLNSSTLNLRTPPNGNIAPPGYYMLFLLDSAGVPSVATFIQLTPYTTVPPTGTIASPAAATVTVAAGGTVNFGTATNAAKYSWVFPGGTPGTSTAQNPGNIRFTTGGVYTASLTVIDSSGNSDPHPPTRVIKVTPATADFDITAGPQVREVNPGQSATFSVNVAPMTGFTGPVTLAVESEGGFPAGVSSGGFSPATINGSGSSTLTMHTTTNTIPYALSLSITGTSGALSHTAGTTLLVNLDPPASVSAVPGAGKVTLSWPASVGGTSYQVKRSNISGGPYQMLACPATTNYLDTAVVGGTDYYYVVSAAYSGNPNAGGSSADSNETRATPTTAQPPSCPCTIWPTSAAPVVAADADRTLTIEVGVKFRSTVSGFISGMRFYKSSTNTGAHVGTLWTAAGGQLARATFTGESSSGWQQVNFASPVAVTAGTTYVASYHTNAGHYAADVNFFAASAVTNGPLRALKNGEDGANGVYIYNANPTFPTNSYQSTNYWVDVVFTTTGGGGDTTAPTVVARTPAPNTTVATNSVINATFSESVQASTISFTLKAGATTIPASVSYNSGTFVATLTPSAALSAATTYTATVANAKDSAGNTMSAVSWSFTTAAAGAICPCSLFPATATPNVVADGDISSIEVGVKFRADNNGTITGIRFFKSSANTGIHTASLWSSTGTLLGQVQFTNETASGWQQVSFPTPIAVNAGVTYVASYHANGGRYSDDTGYFIQGVDRGPLHAPANTAQSPNGVYRYGTGPIFPNTGFQASNYWVDVVFVPSP